MPHKRAKRSQRERERHERGMDSAPTATSLKLDAEGIPKSVARIIHAASIQEKFREAKKRAREDEAVGGPAKRAKVGSKELKILPGESMGMFNRRVEDTLRPTVQAARTSARKSESNIKPKRLPDDEKHKDNDSEHIETKDKPAVSNPPKQFAKASTVSRVRDVVQAPPSFANDKFAKKISAKLDGKGASKITDVVSSAHQRMMELEREKAIARYRALKAAKAASHSD